MYCFAKVLENGTPLCICKYTLDALCDKYVPNKMISYLKLQTLEFKMLIGVPFLLQIKNHFFWCVNSDIYLHHHIISTLNLHSTAYMYL